MNIIGGGVANLTGIPVRKHSDLQNLTGNDHPWYSAEPNRIATGTFTQGVDASKSGSPTTGSTYYATDTKKFYICFGSSTWTQVDDVCTPTGAAQGDVLYFDGTKWARLAAGTAGYALITNGASANPSYSLLTATHTINDNAGTSHLNTAVGTWQNVKTYSSIPAITAGQTLWLRWNISDSLTGGAPTSQVRIQLNGVNVFSGSTAAGHPNWIDAGDLNIIVSVPASAATSMGITSYDASGAPTFTGTNIAPNLSSTWSLTVDNNCSTANAMTTTINALELFIFN